jgi:hypothetical protein
MSLLDNVSIFSRLGTYAQLVSLGPVYTRLCRKVPFGTKLGPRSSRPSPGGFSHGFLLLVLILGVQRPIVTKARIASDLDGSAG